MAVRTFMSLGKNLTRDFNNIKPPKPEVELSLISKSGKSDVLCHNCGDNNHKSAKCNNKDISYVSIATDMTIRHSSVKNQK